MILLLWQQKIITYVCVCVCELCAQCIAGPVLRRRTVVILSSPSPFFLLPSLSPLLSLPPLLTPVSGISQNGYDFTLVAFTPIKISKLHTT